MVDIDSTCNWEDGTTDDAGPSVDPADEPDGPAWGSSSTEPKISLNRNKYIANVV